MQANLLSDPLFIDAVLAGILLTSTCALLGFFVVVKRSVFTAMTVAQAATTGVALHAVVGWSIATSLGHGLVGHIWEGWGVEFCALFVLILVLALVALAGRALQIPEDAILGAAYAFLGGLGLLFVARSPTGVAEVSALVNGDVLFVTRSHLAVIAAASAGAWVLVWLAWRRLLLVVFDEETAEAAGITPWRWNAAFSLLLGLTVALSIRFAGLLLVIAALVAPAAAGLSVSRSCHGSALLGMALAAVGAMTGLTIAFAADLPASPLVVVSICILSAVLIVIGARRSSASSHEGLPDRKSAPIM